MREVCQINFNLSAGANTVLEIADATPPDTNFVKGDDRFSFLFFIGPVYFESTSETTVFTIPEFTSVKLSFLEADLSKVVQLYYFSAASYIYMCDIYSFDMRKRHEIDR